MVRQRFLPMFRLSSACPQICVGSTLPALWLPVEQVGGAREGREQSPGTTERVKGGREVGQCDQEPASTSMTLDELFKWRGPDVSPDIMHTPSGPVDMVTIRRAALFMEAVLYETAVMDDRASWRRVSVVLTDKQPALHGQIGGPEPLSLTFWGHVTLVRSPKAIAIATFSGLTFFLTDSCANITSECFCPAWSVLHDEGNFNMKHVQKEALCSYDVAAGAFRRVADGARSPADFAVTVHALQSTGEAPAGATASDHVLLQRSHVSDAEREKAEREAARAKGKAKAKGKSKGKAVAPAAGEKRKAEKEDGGHAGLLANLGPAGAQLAYKTRDGPPERRPKKEKAKVGEDASHLLR